MNIFSSLRTYAGKWNFKSSRKFEAEELAAVSHAVVVASEYGNSAMFTMVAGGNKYIPMSNDSTLGVGDTIDLAKAELVTLEKEGESDIVRVKA